MPFFGSSRRDPSPPEVIKNVPIEHESSRKHGLFHRRAHSDASSSGSNSPVRGSSSRPTPMSTHPGPSRTSTLSSRTGTIKSGLFSKRHHGDVDPSILEARERVESAETAEMEADRALDQARLRVREAREKENMKRVELEAKEEIRRAQLKQHHAKEVMKRGQGLGRHG